MNNAMHPAAAAGVRNHRLRRGVSLLPALFTVGNLSLGYFAVLSTLKGTVAGFDDAARAIGFAILFDMLDGRVARATNTTSEFGKQFDSLADVISFGVAPALLAFAWGIQGFFTVGPSPERNLYWMGLIVTATFVTSCAWRLARFNIQGMAPGQEARYFVGMPTPAGAGVIAAVVHAFKNPIEVGWQAVLWLALVASVAALMASTIRYYGFKDINLRRRRTSLVVVLAGLLLWSVIVYSEEVLLILAGAYMLSGIATHAGRHWRRPARPPDHVQSA
jgi:CDP-diacylglycerol--serine O-phosphatidyltransferase